MGFGEVIVRKSPINPHTYHLTITASDRGNPSRSSTAIVIVNVIATNEVNCTETDFGKVVSKYITSKSKPDCVEFHSRS